MVDPNLLSRLKLTAEEWADIPDILQKRMQRRFEVDRAKQKAKHQDEIDKCHRRFIREIQRKEKPQTWLHSVAFTFIRAVRTTEAVAITGAIA